MKDNNWIDDLRKKEHDFEVRVPEGLWEDIERNLPSAVSPQRRIVPLWLRYGGVAAAVAVCLIIAVPLLFPEGESVVTVSEKARTKAIAEDGHNLVAESENTDFENVVRENLLPLKRRYHVAEVVQSAASAGTLSDDMDGQEQTVAEPVDTASTAATPSTPSTAAPSVRRQQPSVATKETKRRKSGDWSLTAYAGNLMANAKSSTTGYSPVVGTLSPYNGVANVPMGADKANDIVTMNRGENIDTETHHKLPLRFGLSCGIPLSGRLSIETGITYSILSSSTVSGTEKNYFDTEQTLHYIGVPLKLHYNLWQTRKFGVYVSGGGMVEKCVYGSSDTDFIIGTEKTSSTSETVSEKRLQFSVMGGGGLEYRLTEALNLFVEPAVSYSFDNHSSVDNSYKEHPLNFDLKIGVRFDIKR